jgi:FtsZ-binding cell division protein ZapB
MSESLWIALIAGIPGIAALIIGYLTMKATARKDTITNLMAENDKLWKRINELQTENDWARQQIEELRRQLLELGHVPRVPRIRKEAENG